jgi:hypothetical protein
MRGLDDLVRQGTVHYTGVSDTPAWLAITVLCGYYFVQLRIAPPGAGARAWARARAREEARARATAIFSNESWRQSQRSSWEQIFSYSVFSRAECDIESTVGLRVCLLEHHRSAEIFAGAHRLASVLSEQNRSLCLSTVSEAC